jgi:5-methylcytosine-specific restriction endonuclease McrA
MSTPQPTPRTLKYCPLMSAGVKRRQIPRAARYGVWEAWDGCCYWCQEPISPFGDCEIDHVIPLEALRSVGAEELRRRYALPSDFDFDDFPNWVPTHRRCNQRKRELLLDASPVLLLDLTVVRSKVTEARGISEKIQSDQRKTPILVRLATSIENGTLTKEEIEDFLSDLPRTIRKGLDLPEVHLFIAPNWEVIRSGDGRSVRVISNPQAGSAISFASSRPTEFD